MFNSAWKKDVHLLPINWRPVSNGFVIWSRQLRINRPSSPSSRRPSHIRRRSSPSNKRWLLHTRSNWRRPPSNCDSSSGRCSANAASGTPFPRPDVAFRARGRRGTGSQAGDHAGRQCGFAAASGQAKAATTEDRVPAILGTPADQVSVATGGIALRLLWGRAGHHPHPRHEAGGDGRGKDVRGRRGAVHLRLFPLPRRLADADHREATAGRGEKAPSGRASWLGW